MATIASRLPRTDARQRTGATSRRAAGRARAFDVYFIKRVDNSRLRREVSWEKLRQCYLILGLLVAVFGATFLIAWQHFQCVRSAYQIEQLKTLRGELEEANRELRLENAALADPQRIDVRARQEFGLVPVTPDRLRQVGPSTDALREAPEFARNLPSGGTEPATMTQSPDQGPSSEP